MTQREQQILQWIREDPRISQQELADRAGITRSSMGVHISNLMKKGYIAGKGYILAGEDYDVVVGAVNVDVGGIPRQALVKGDSNPGTVRTTLGGVGRNIAHNMALLGVDTRMITALGDDVYARNIAASCAELGIDLTRSLRIPGENTSTYLYINDEKGDMALALSDMEIYRHVTPAALASRLPWMNNAQVLVLDANLPAETLGWLSNHVEIPVVADPGSAAKAEKLRPVLGKLNTIKPNRLEAEILSGVTITDERSLHHAADALLATGLHRVFISLGGEGVLAADRSQRLRLPILPARIANTTGSGDAFMAALVWAYLRGTDLLGSVRAGLAAAAIAMEGEGTVNPAMSAAALLSRMEQTENEEKTDQEDR